MSRRSSARRDTYDGRAVALADLGNRGVLDVIVANQRGPLLIYKNTVAAGTALDSIRARRALDGSGREQSQRRSVRGSSCTGRIASRSRRSAAASGFSAQNQRRLHYGLGDADAVDRVVIRWPSGRRRRSNGRRSTRCTT